VLIRQAAEHVVDLVTLRGAVTGALLIVIVIYLPEGMGGLVDGTRRLTWREIWSRFAAETGLGLAFARDGPGDTLAARDGERERPEKGSGM
jgi:hypothetical protein